MKNKPKVLKTVQKRVIFLCAKFFELMEKGLPDLLKEKKWQEIRTKMLDLCNDIVRANTEDLEDASIVFRPLAVSFNKDKVTCSIKLMNILRNMDFMIDPPSFSIKTDMKNSYLLDCIRDELGLGIVEHKFDQCIYSVKGDDCRLILVVLDKIMMTREIREKYLGWRYTLEIKHER